jgi:hypothetical protein
MKVFRVQDPVTNEFLSTSTRGWTTDVGTIFTSIQAAKKGVSYQKRYAARYLGYYVGDSSWDVQSRANWTAVLAKTNRCEIIEYEMVESKRYNGQGVTVNEPIPEGDTGKALNECDCLNDKIDFSKI